MKEDFLLNLKIHNVEEWKSILNATKQISENLMLLANFDELSLRSIDESHISLLQITLPLSSFEKYFAKTTYFAVPINDFFDIINTANNDDTIDLTASSKQILSILINGQLKMEFNLHLLDKTKVNIPIPEIDYAYKFSVNPQLLTRILTNIGTVSQNVIIEANEDLITFMGKGDICDAKIFLATNSRDVDLIFSKVATTSSYYLDHLLKISKSLSHTSTKMVMEFASKNPLHIQFEMSSKAIVDYYIAPRID